jgi:general secretion pathway protein D
MQRLSTLPGAALGACGLMSLLLTSCAEPPGSGRSAITDTLNNVSFDPPKSADGPVSVTPVGSGDSDSGGPDRRPEVFLGSSTAVQATTASPLGSQARRSADGVEVNFDRADVHEVAKVILGEILKVPYTVDPRVAGEVTLATGGPVSERDLVSALETVLSGLNATVVDHGGTYAIVPADDLQGPAAVQPLGGSGIRVPPGFGVTIVPLRYMSATAAAQFVQPLLHRAEDIRVDPTRNLILFAGSTAERQNVVETLADLDVDWLSGKSVGIFPLNVATPESIIPELEALFGAGTAADPTSGLVRFMPMARLNAVLAIANSPQQIVQAQSWVSRLDRGNRGVGAQFYVYQLKHAPAEDIAKVLAESFSEAASGGGTSPSSLFGGAIEPAAPFGSVQTPGDNSGAQPDVQSPVPYGGGAGGQSEAPAAGSLSPVFGGAGANTTLASTGPLLGGVKIVPNKLNNTLLIRATPQLYEMMEAALRRLDTAPLQVLIEATIAEVTLNNQLRYGVQY